MTELCQKIIFSVPDKLFTIYIYSITKILLSSGSAMSSKNNKAGSSKGRRKIVSDFTYPAVEITVPKKKGTNTNNKTNKANSNKKKGESDKKRNKARAVEKPRLPITANGGTSTSMAKQKPAEAPKCHPVPSQMENLWELDWATEAENI